MALLPSDPKKQRVLLAGIIPLLVAVAYWYFVHQGRVAEIAQMSGSYEQLQTKNAAAKILAERGGPELKKKLALYEQQVARLEQLIPRREEVPDLLHDITVQATDADVELNLMRPEAPRPAAPVAGKGGGASPPLYTRQIYSMSVYGLYENVGRFLAAVGSLPRIVTPVHLRMVPLREMDRETGARKVAAEFQIETFVAPEGTAADAASTSPLKEKPGNAGK